MSINQRLLKAFEGLSENKGGMNLEELKQIAEQRGVSTSGTRSDIVARLKDYIFISDKTAVDDSNNPESNALELSEVDTIELEDTIDSIRDLLKYNAYKLSFWESHPDWTNQNFLIELRDLRDQVHILREEYEANLFKYYNITGELYYDIKDLSDRLRKYEEDLSAFNTIVDENLDYSRIVIELRNEIFMTKIDLHLSLYLYGLKYGHSYE